MTNTADAAEFEHAARTMMTLAGAADRARFRHFVRAEAFADAAILFHRAMLPEHGFQFGLPPCPTGAPGAAFALSWRRTEACATPFSAATPALALLRATTGIRMKAFEADRLAACSLCRGLGWYVATDNRKQRCCHTPLSRAAE